MPTPRFRRMQTSATVANRFELASIGDSITLNYDLGVRPLSFHPIWLEGKLRALGAHVTMRNWGISGDTTTGMLARIGAMTHYAIPDYAQIAGGVNDPGNSIDSATTTANIVAMITALRAAGVTRIVVVGAHYLNYTSGGDAIDTPYAPYVPVRAAQLAAATAAGVPFCDVYAYMRNLIVTGVETARSASWHVAGTNQHPNAHGGDVISSAILASIQAQTGWLAAMQ